MSTVGDIMSTVGDILSTVSVKNFTGQALILAGIKLFTHLTKLPVLGNAYL